MSEFQNESLAPRRGRPPLNPPASSPEVVEPARRETRRPFGALEQKLAHNIREGYHGHWFNDTSGRIARALEAGYEHVKNKEGKNVSRIVGTAEGGGALTAFLMEIREDWYKEDMAREQQMIDEREASIKKGMKRAPDGTEMVDVENAYIAKNLGGIRIGDKPR